MKKSIFNREIKEEIFSRLNNLTASSEGKWGKMNVNQMLRHLTTGLKVSLGEVKVNDESTFLSRTLMKWIILTNKPVPKGKAKTKPVFDMEAQGINPDDFAKEKEDYKNAIDRMINGEIKNNIHPFLGKLTNDEWSYLAYSHADYHLKQFGV